MPADQDNSARPFFRIVRCCGNCQYSFYYKGNQRRLNCWLPDQHERYKKGKRAFYNKETRQLLPHVHVTTVCDAHQFRSQINSLEIVQEWCGAEYMGD
ncbi:MAG: hypothetical protein ACW98F_00135 [Candidatus Hodarchaeales archaeon]|jgi:hypothetical protein